MTSNALIFHLNKLRRINTSFMIVLQVIKKTLPIVEWDDFEYPYATNVRLRLAYANSVLHSELKMNIICLLKVKHAANLLVSVFQNYFLCGKVSTSQPLSY